MRHYALSFLFVCLFLARPGTAEVATLRETWRDEARHRDVPVKVYYDDAAAGPRAVIVFSHGLGGSRENYAYLGEHWAEQGFVSVHLQHEGSDDAVWRDARPWLRMREMKRAAADPQNAKDRPADVGFAIDQIEALNRDEKSPLHGRLDLEKVGVAGHSFGAYTAMAVAGQTLGAGSGKGVRVADPRVKAAVSMSAPAPRRKDAASLDAAYASIRVPVYHLTGTEDDSPIGETTAEERRIGFDHTTNARAYLLTLAGGDHGAFGDGRRRGRDSSNDERFHELILESTTAFWKATLYGDAAAQAWLDEASGFEKELGADGVFERKGE